MMSGEYNNDAVTHHIWSNLVSENDAVENVVDPVGENQQPIPLQHPSWLSEEERAQREQQLIIVEVLE